MIPETTTDLSRLEQVAQPSRTYKLDPATGHISRMIDGEDAMLQAIMKLLNTERYAYPIYSSQYGVELERLIGKDYDFIAADMQRSIEDALFADDRVIRVEDFTIEKSGTDHLTVSFAVITTEGRKAIETEVAIL